MTGAADCQETLRTTCVRIDVGAKFQGSGLLIAPHKVLTCAHVVNQSGDISVIWEDQEGELKSSPAEIEQLLEDPGPNPFPKLYQYPDIAILHVDELMIHPIARLNAKSKPSHNASVHGAGYSRDLGGPQMDPFSAHVESWVGPVRQLLVKLRDVQILHGLSGSAVATETDAETFGVLTATKGEKATLGGYVVPFVMVASSIAEILEENDQFHRKKGKSYSDGESDLGIMATLVSMALPVALDAIVAKLGVTSAK